MIARYFVTSAPGHYGDKCLVMSSHKSLERARLKCGEKMAIYAGELKKGDTWLRVYEQTYKRM